MAILSEPDTPVSKPAPPAYPITHMQAQWEWMLASGEKLYFPACKGGLLPIEGEGALRLTGRCVLSDTVSDSVSDSASDTATRESLDASPIGQTRTICCVRAGTRLAGAGSVILPCDLYEGDVWYPRTGRVVRQSGVIASYAGEPLPPDFLSTTGGADIGATVVYPLAVPIEECYPPAPLAVVAGDATIEQIPAEGGLCGQLAGGMAVHRGVRAALLADYDNTDTESAGEPTEASARASIRARRGTLQADYQADEAQVTVSLQSSGGHLHAEGVDCIALTVHPAPAM